MNHMVIEVQAEHQDFLKQLCEELPDATIIPVERMTGKELVVTVLLPISLAAAQIAASYITSQQPTGHKRVVISGEVIDAENLTEDELKAALEAYVQTRETSAAEAATTEAAEAPTPPAATPAEPGEGNAPE